jgi:uncharacterized 2Fe-2S/4Fe-4S cluster protein (DUF4445 family)
MSQNTAAATVRVEFRPEGTCVAVPAGETVSSSAAQAGVFISLPCGGRGVCGNCHVKIISGEVAPPTDAETSLLEAELLAKGFRLACQAQILGDIVVEVPQASRALERKEISLLRCRKYTFSPNVCHCLAEVGEATLGDQKSDLARLRPELTEPVSLPLSIHALRALPAAVRSPGHRVRVAGVNRRIVSITPAAERDGIYGAAVDIGTTTVVGYLFDLSNGEYLASAASYNPQAQHGADVISRINFALTEHGGLAQLQAEAVSVVNEVIQRAAAQAQVEMRHIYEVTLVGNTCMHHLALGLDPAHLGASPYVPVVDEAVDVEARDLGLGVNPSANVHFLPVIAGFVGADTVGVILAAELLNQPRPVLAVDIGTNGEVALWSGSDLLVASCAAGPAFEGAQIQHGMRAGPGAIERVDVQDGDLAIHTIGGLSAVGICGSGLFDAVAALLDLGLLDISGRLAPDGAASGPAAWRLEGEGTGRRVTLARAEETADRSPVLLTQPDVRKVQLAKGAVRAAVELLLRRAGLAPKDLSEVLLAGAFGNYVNPRSALRIGLLPEVLEPEHVRGIGNAAGAGAVLALLSIEERRKAEELAARAVHVELFSSPEFQDVFAEAMLFP